MDSTSEQIVDEYRRRVVTEGRWRCEASLARYDRFLYGDTSFAGASVLDVGGGAGVCSLYASIRGAKRVVCLEPGAAGSTAGVQGPFERMASGLGVDNVEFVATTLQDYEGGEGEFDVVISHNSINHLDERACERLSHDGEARDAYRAIFAKVGALAAPTARVIVADCSSQSLYPRLGLRHPISSDIEWSKHQPPEVWAELLAEVGFSQPRIRWSSYNRLGALGWTLFANRLAAYVLTAHFRLHMDRTQAGSQGPDR